MAEHVAGSLELGHPVIVHGRIAMRAWEKDGRTGQTLEVEAYGVGHDLRWGTAAFKKQTRKEPDAADADAVAADLATSFDREEAVNVVETAA
jgi:single-strand DNA-binding protein